MSNAIANVNIALTNSAIFDGSEVTLIKSYGDLGAYANNTGTAVAIMAPLDEDDLFSVSGWQKHPGKSLLEIADALMEA